MYYIYGITDPDTKQVRYVGITGKSPTQRLIGHLSGCLSSATSSKNQWLVNIVNSGRLPELVVLQTTDTERSAQISERWWIAHGQAIGWDLVNDAQMVKPILSNPLEDQLVDILDSPKNDFSFDEQHRTDAEIIKDVWLAGQSQAEMIRVLTGDPAANTGGHNRRRLIAALNILESEDSM